MGVYPGMVASTDAMLDGPPTCMSLAVIWVVGVGETKPSRKMRLEVTVTVSTEVDAVDPFAAAVLGAFCATSTGAGDGVFVALPAAS